MGHVDRGRAPFEIGRQVHCRYHKAREQDAPQRHAAIAEEGVARHHESIEAIEQHECDVDL